jgi:uncharacterized HAD superfamily protein
MIKYAVDLDDTIFDFKYSFSLFCKITHGIDFTENDLSYTNYISKKLGERRSKLLLDDFGKKNGYLNTLPIRVAVDSLKELSKGNQIYIMTCRPARFRGQTEESLRINGIDFRDLFIYEKIDKINICKSIGINCLIEDNIKACMLANKMNIRSYLVDTTPSASCKGTSFEPTSWLEILRKEMKLNGIML